MIQTDAKSPKDNLAFSFLKSNIIHYSFIIIFGEFKNRSSSIKGK